MDEATAAVKIQAAFRGLSVRKPAPLKKLRVIEKTKAEAAEIRRRISDCHVVEMIRRDEKERVKMSEWIMSLLLRLDAIQGVNSFVRESRKAVTREVVNLQETVDDVITGKSMKEMDMEVLVSSEVPENECPNVEKNTSAQCSQGSSIEEIKDEELPGRVKAVAVNDAEAEQNEMQEEESLYSQMQILQMEDSHENENDNNCGLENFEQGFLVVRQTIYGPEQCTTVGGTGEDAGNLKENKLGSPVLEPDTAHRSPSREEDVMTGNLRDNERSFEALDLFKTEAIESDEGLEADDNMDYEEVGGVNDRGNEFPKKEAVEDIGMVREENESLKRTVADLLKISAKQSEMINNMNLRIAQLEAQVSLCSKKKKIEGRKKSSGESNNFSGVLTCEDNQNATTPASTEERTARPNDRTSRIKFDKHLNHLVEDWF